jgi:hypothetical protein
MITARLANLIRRNKKEVMFTTFWIAIVSAVVIISYYSIYLTSVWGYWKTAFSVSPWEGPSIDIIGITVLVIVGIVAGYVIDDSRSLIFACSFTIIISFSIAVAFSFCYIWFVLNYQPTGVVPYAWEWYLYMAVVIIFRMFIPTALFTCLFGAALGSIIRVYILGK